MQLTWLGHSACHLAIAGKSVLIDPFFTGNAKFPAEFESGLEAVDAIIVTHGHADHLGDTERLANTYDATVIAMFEICAYLGARGVKSTDPMNIGGTIDHDGLTITMVNALHSSAIVENGIPITMGDPAGIVIKSSEKTVYHAGDTEIFSDMALIQRLHQPKIGLIPIGDRFTMGPDTAALACNEFLDLETIIPIHWGTFDLLTGDPSAFKSQVERGAVLTPAPGEPIQL
ncbi:MAG: metal-dependent hydrolase [Alphaproteobacteria bacterium]|nr:metal-dependent hydrolase [Alphaproteobacteria bacterium]